MLPAVKATEPASGATAARRPGGPGSDGDVPEGEGEPVGEVEVDGEGEGEPVGGVPVTDGVGLLPDGSGVGWVRVGDALGVRETPAGLEEAGAAPETADDGTAAGRPEGGTARRRARGEGPGEGSAVKRSVRGVESLPQPAPGPSSGSC
ncbi:hypothetical protein [Streptomyces sp. NPDC003857]